MAIGRYKVTTVMRNLLRRQFHVKPMTLEDVKAKIEQLKQIKRQREEQEKADAEIDIGARIKRAEDVDAAEREEKRRKRNEKRRKGKDGVKQEDEWEGRLGIIV